MKTSVDKTKAMIFQAQFHNHPSEKLLPFIYTTEKSELPESPDPWIIPFEEQTSFKYVGQQKQRNGNSQRAISSRVLQQKITQTFKTEVI